MKHFVLTLLTSALLFGGHDLSAQQPPSFDAKDAAGIYTLDVEKTIKKMKVEDKATQDSIAKALHVFNAEMDQLSADHAATFQALDARFDQQIKIAMQRRDRSQMDGVKQEIQRTIPPIRQQVMAHEETLNASMKAVLDEKQHKKWLSYQKGQRPPVPRAAQ